MHVQGLASASGIACLWPGHCCLTNWGCRVLDSAEKASAKRSKKAKAPEPDSVKVFHQQLKNASSLRMISSASRMQAVAYMCLQRMHTTDLCPDHAGDCLEMCATRQLHGYSGRTTCCRQ